MEFNEIIYQPGRVAQIILNRPQYLNAQSWLLRNELDTAFDAAVADRDVGVIVVSGMGGNFSAGHDIGTPEDRKHRSQIGHLHTDQKGIYDDLKEINVTNTMRWRKLPKPTIAMVEGYCIFGGWMIAAAMDVLFSDENALFLPGQTQYFSVPWDIGPKRAKEILFEHRFLSAEECYQDGFVNRVFSGEDLQRETLAYANRVAENYLSNPMGVETTKRTINHMVDTQGFSAEIESGFESFAAMQGLVARGQPAPRAGGYARTDTARANFIASRGYVRAKAPVD